MFKCLGWRCFTKILLGKVLAALGLFGSSTPLKSLNFFLMILVDSGWIACDGEGTNFVAVLWHFGYFAILCDVWCLIFTKICPNSFRYLPEAFCQSSCFRADWLLQWKYVTFSDGCMCWHFELRPVNELIWLVIWARKSCNNFILVAWVIDWAIEAVRWNYYSTLVQKRSTTPEL